MAKYQERTQAIHFRRRGKSIKWIAERLHVSKSTVSLWCRDIILTKRQEQRLHQVMLSAGHNGRMMGALANKKKREEQIQFQNDRARKELKKLNTRDLLVLGIGLYWGEGSKNRERKFVFTNSDSKAIRCMIMWLKMIGIPKKDVVIQVYINSQHGDRIQGVINYWRKELKLSNNQFRRPVLVRTVHKKVYSNRESYFGVARLTVKSSSKIKDYIMGLIDYAKSQV